MLALSLIYFKDDLLSIIIADNHRLIQTWYSAGKQNASFSCNKLYDIFNIKLWLIFQLGPIES